MKTAMKKTYTITAVELEHNKYTYHVAAYSLADALGMYHDGDPSIRTAEVEWGVGGTESLSVVEASSDD